MDLNDPQTKSRKKGTGIFGCVFALLLIFGAMYIFLTVFSEGWDMLEAPWAHSFSGHPTMTGGWAGEFTSPDGIQFALYLDIERAKLPDGSYYTEDNVGAIIAGEADWCDNSGRHAESNPVEGSVPAFSGFNGNAHKIKIFLEHPSHPQVGLSPNEFEGDWNGDTLMLRPTSFLSWDGNTLVATSGVPDLTGPSALIMKKGDQNTFQALCEKIKN